MNFDHYRQLLEAKEKELVADMAHLEADTIDQADPGVQDEMDLAVQSESKDLLLGLKSQDYGLLQQVRAAIKRIDDGTYGKCGRCGQPMDSKRLEAVPWALYDVQHQPDSDPGTSS